MQNARADKGDVADGKESCFREQTVADQPHLEKRSFANESDREKVIRVLKDAGESLGLPLLKLKTGIDRRQLEATIHAMIREGLLLEVQTGRGTRYSYK